MLVECVHGDFSDPEAVSGSSTICFRKRKHPLQSQERVILFVFNSTLQASFLGQNKKRKKDRQLRVKPILLQWSVELFWNRFLFLAFAQEFYSKATSIIKRQNAHVNKKCVVIFTLFCAALWENCC